MALSFAKIRIQDNVIMAEKGYEPFVYDDTCVELINLVTELNLDNLKHIPYVLNTIFNYFQCKEILAKEVPVLLLANLSEKAREAVQGLEYALKDIIDPLDYLLLEGD